MDMLFPFWTEKLWVFEDGLLSISSMSSSVNPHFQVDAFIMYGHEYMGALAKDGTDLQHMRYGTLFGSLFLKTWLPVDLQGQFEDD